MSFALAKFLSTHYIIYHDFLKFLYKDALNDINSITYSKDDIDNHLNEMTKYIYTFEKIDNNYLLVSYKYKK